MFITIQKVLKNTDDVAKILHTQVIECDCYSKEYLANGNLLIVPFKNQKKVYLGLIFPPEEIDNEKYHINIYIENNDGKTINRF